MAKKKTAAKPPARSKRAKKAAPREAKPAVKAAKSKKPAGRTKPKPAAKKTAKKASKPATAAKRAPSAAKRNGPVVKAGPKAAARPMVKKATAKPTKAKKTAAAAKPVKKAAPVAQPRPVSKPKSISNAKSAAKPKGQPAAPVEAMASKPMQTAPNPVQAPAPPPSPAPPTPVKKQVSRPARPQKERVVMEFAVHSNPNVLFELLSTPSGFSEWYCDDVDVRGDQYTFKWGSDEEATTMIGRKAPEVIRFRRNEEEDAAAFFEFRIRIDDMTNEVALIVTDHAWPGEVDNVRSLWSSQIANLTRVLGA